MPKLHSTAPMRRVLGAGVIVVTAVASSLVASGAQAAQTLDDAPQVVGPLVTETSPFEGAMAFSAPSAAAAGQPVPANRAGTLAQARAAAVNWFVPAAGSTSTVRPQSDPGLCLTAGSTTITNSSPVTLEACDDDDPAQRFTQAANTGSNNPIGTGLKSTYNDGFLGLFNKDDVMRLQSKTVADRVPTIDDFIAAFTARLDGIDVLARTARISGTGTPNATVLVNGGAPVRVDGNGAWSTTVGSLVFGPNQIALEQYEGSEQTGSATLTAELTADALTFDTTFPPDIDAPVVASGTAHPGALVSLFGPDGQPIGAPVTADVVSGAWSTTIPAPDAGGSYRVTASQSLSGLRDTTHDVTKGVDYGAAVTIDTPADDSVQPAGPLRMEGRGEPESRIEVLDTSNGDVVVGRSADGVLPNGRWTLDTDALDRSEHVLRVVQHSKGANTTVAEVTVNPGSTSRLAPVTLTRPDTVTPGVTNTFVGTAEPDATYEVLNVSGTPLVPGSLSVAGDGTWTFDRVISNGATEFRFRIRQTKDGVTETSELFVLRANAGFAPVVPDAQTVRPGEVNTFTGSGPAGARYEVLNASGTPIVPGIRPIDAGGRWTFDRAVSAGQLDFKFKFRITIDGASYTTSLFTVSANTR
ncbi:ricin-type beta-trefoil lectin domain protein [Curtobacterium sp. 9128]|uniref:ricin-type beta-trefoil lectin domain protein n=1 Tax=Curtobacterium sp. 9128 TaxID=1793722 RepID=UPI0011A9CC86|nr:ricin-type beta-trefoil lectin domain protein [Curtobacterium sp. 9128]